MKTISGYVIAGGKSSRFGSNKALALLGKKSMIEYSLDLLYQYTHDIYISGRREEYKSLNISMIEDIVSQKGPIGGIYSCLIKSQTEYNLILSCDMPFVSTQMIECLLRHAEANDVTYFKNNKNEIYPFPGIYTTKCLSVIEQMLQANNYRMKYLLDNVSSNSCEVPTQDEYRLINIHRQEDLNDSLAFI